MWTRSLSTKLFTVELKLLYVWKCTDFIQSWQCMISNSWKTDLNEECCPNSPCHVKQQCDFLWMWTGLLALTRINTSGWRQASSANTTLAFWPPRAGQTQPSAPRPCSLTMSRFLAVRCRWSICSCSYQTVWRSVWCERGSPAQTGPDTSCHPGREGWSSSSGTRWRSPPCSAGQRTAGWRSPLSARN